MAPLFRIVADPRIHLSRMWSERRRFAFDVGGYGLCEIVETALRAYICLNVFFLKPELYDAEMKRNAYDPKVTRNVPAVPPELYDYRLTAAYQRMLVYNTGSKYPDWIYGVHRIPHREFFGVPVGMYHEGYVQRRKYGEVTISELVDKDSPYKYIPNKSDIPVMISLLQMKRLPTELALQILEFADYTPKGRLPVRDDPLHIDNAEELRKYLAYCWKLMVRVEMLTSVDWELEVTEVIWKLFGQSCPRMITIDIDDSGGRRMRFV